MNNPLPERLNKYFWDCDFHELSMEKYAFFVTERILNLGDMDSVKWLMGQIDHDFLKNVVDKSRNLNKKTSNYWEMVLNDREPAY